MRLGFGVVSLVVAVLILVAVVRMLPAFFYACNVKLNRGSTLLSIIIGLVITAGVAGLGVWLIWGS